MNSDMFILIYCFTVTVTGINAVIHFSPFLKKVDGLEDYLSKEATAIKSLVAIEDVLACWNESNAVHGFGSSWITLPDGNGTTKVAIIEPEESGKTPKLGLGARSWSNDYDFEEATEKVQFKLYDKERPKGVAFVLGSMDTLEFDTKNGIKIISHGWRSNGESDIIQGIKNAYLAEQNVPVIGVDWSYAANSVIYNLCAQKTVHVGKAVGTLINRLAEKFDIPFEDFHIIGHSLGAHISGFAGRLTKSKVGRITGLDPALPGFQFLELAGGRLDKTDALFVDVIHSCASSLGMSIPIGHVDFYPNGGSPKQPGCPDYMSEDVPRSLDTIACSHARSYQFYAESIRKNSDFTSVKCESWTQFKDHECSKNFTTMGEYVQKNSTGTYYLVTNERSPFHRGMKGTIF